MAANQPLKVLYIDDDPINRKLMERMLKSYGHECLTATDARHGIRAAVTHQPDVIIMDYMLPGQNGLDATQTLKCMPETTDIPVIMLTADVVTLTQQAALGAGCVALVHKPISPHSLMHTLSQVAQPHLSLPS
jgi:CheY-like chemotaxis protein